MPVCATCYQDLFLSWLWFLPFVLNCPTSAPKAVDMSSACKNSRADICLMCAAIVQSMQFLFWRHLFCPKVMHLPICARTTRVGPHSWRSKAQSPAGRPEVDLVWCCKRGQMANNGSNCLIIVEGFVLSAFPCGIPISHGSVPDSTSTSAPRKERARELQRKLFMEQEAASMVWPVWLIWEEVLSTY